MYTDSISETANFTKRVPSLASPSEHTLSFNDKALL